LERAVAPRFDRDPLSALSVLESTARDRPRAIATDLDHQPGYHRGLVRTLELAIFLWLRNQVEISVPVRTIGHASFYSWAWT
jgi:hypothetical protein